MSPALQKMLTTTDYKNKKMPHIIGCPIEDGCANSAVNLDMSNSDKIIHLVNCATLNNQFLVIKFKILKDNEEKHVMVFTDTGNYSSNTKLITELDGIFGHEIRNSLTNMNIINQNLIDGLNDGEIEDFEHLLRLAEQNIEVLEKILTTYTSLKQKILSDSYISNVETSVYAILKEILQDYSALAKSKNIETKIIPHDANTHIDKFMVNYNKGLIYLLFSNLLNNALKYCRPDSVINIELLKNDDSLTVLIDNEGELEYEIVKNFFSRYIKGQNSTGTGFGTYCSKLLTELFKGNINMKYEDNHIKISVTIPF